MYKASRTASRSACPTRWHQQANPARLSWARAACGAPGGGGGGQAGGSAPPHAGPPCPAPFPGSDFLSPPCSLLSRGPVPQEAEASSEPGRAGPRLLALCWRLQPPGGSAGPCPPLANPLPAGPASQLWLLSGRSPLAPEVWSLSVGGHEVWGSHHSPGRGGPSSEPAGWGGARPIPTPAAEASGRGGRTPGARPARREGSRLQAQQRSEQRELSPPLLAFAAFLKALSRPQPSQDGAGSANGRGRRGEAGAALHAGPLCPPPGAGERVGCLGGWLLPPT